MNVKFAVHLCPPPHQKPICHFRPRIHNLISFLNDLLKLPKKEVYELISLS